MDFRHGKVDWVKSTRCSTGGCVEVAVMGEEHLVRDSKLMDGSPILAFGPDGWKDFLRAVVAGEFDRA